jgi:hypothetical protein
VIDLNSTAATPARSTVTSTTRVYITVKPTATGTGIIPSHNGTLPIATAQPSQYTGAGSNNAVPAVVLGAAALFAALV